MWGVGISLDKKWVDKINDISRKDRMIAIMILVQGTIFSFISVYALQGCLGNKQKADFYDSLINVVRNVGEKEIVVIAGHFTNHVGINPENYED